MESIDRKYIIEAKYQKKINKNVSQCLTCERMCRIAKGKTGHCQTRINNEGVIYSIVYGCNAGISNNPIEKKPLYHFYPGSMALTIGTFGCNFDCFWCQNHHMSHPEGLVIEFVKNKKYFISPEAFIDKALELGCQGTSISFNEPTLLFEYSLDVFKRAKESGLYNTYITNGYMTEEVLRALIKSGLDAMNIDIKGDAEMVRKYCGADVDKVWRNAKLAKELGVHIEITTVLIKKLNTEKETIKKIARKILDILGKDTPYHISRFFPHYKSLEHGYFLPTPEKLLYDAYEIAKSVGLDYTYLGNLTNNEFDHTQCPKCSSLVIKRNIFEINKIGLDNHGNCANCGYSIMKM